MIIFAPFRFYSQFWDKLNFGAHKTRSACQWQDNTIQQNNNFNGYDNWFRYMLPKCWNILIAIGLCQRVTSFKNSIESFARFASCDQHDRFYNKWKPNFSFHFTLFFWVINLTPFACTACSFKQINALNNNKKKWCM